jgi:hypothetical protein
VRRTSALTLLEVAISLALLLTLLAPIYLLFIRAREQAAETRYLRLARIAAEHEVERMRELANRERGSFATVPATFDGRRFVVDGLPPRKDGLVEHGLVEVLLDESHVGVDLDGRDADDDGDPANDVLTPDGDYRALPVRVSIWWGLEGTPKLTLQAVVAKKTDYLRTNE